MPALINLRFQIHPGALALSRKPRQLVKFLWFELHLIGLARVNIARHLP
jgi:hypothetical protein